MSEEMRLKPTNRKFKIVEESWMVEVEDSRNFIKITHKSGFYNLRIFCGENISSIFEFLTVTNSEDSLVKILSSTMMISQKCLTDMPFLTKAVELFGSHYNLDSPSVYTDEEHDSALNEVKSEFEEREKLEAELTPEVLEDIELNKQN